MSHNPMGRIQLFQSCDLFLRQSDGQRADSFFQMRNLGCPDDERRHRQLHQRRTPRLAGPFTSP